MCISQHPSEHSGQHSIQGNPWAAGRLRALAATAAALLPIIALATESPASVGATLPGKMLCRAVQTAGLHDYAGAPESYEASTFFESKFDLRINKVLTRHLAGAKTGVAEATPDLFLTLLPDASSQGPASPVELRCRQVQGQSGELGYSCSNTPPSEMLLINPASLRFTRASIGGWTFSDSAPATQETQRSNSEPGATPNAGGGEHFGNDSLFVEYGSCSRR